MDCKHESVNQVAMQYSDTGNLVTMIMRYNEYVVTVFGLSTCCHKTHGPGTSSQTPTSNDAGKNREFETSTKEPVRDGHCRECMADRRRAPDGGRDEQVGQQEYALYAFTQ